MLKIYSRYICVLDPTYLKNNMQQFTWYWQTTSLHNHVMIRFVPHFGIHEGRQLWASLSSRNCICIKDNHSFHLYFYRVSIQFSVRDNLENVKEIKMIDRLLGLKGLRAIFSFNRRLEVRNPKKPHPHPKNSIKLDLYQKPTHKKIAALPSDYLRKQSKETFICLKRRNCTYE